MNISELIEMGEVVARRCYKHDQYIGYYSGQEYEGWLTLAIRFVDMNFPGDTDAKRFREIAENAYGSGDDKYHALIGILKAFKEYPPTSPKVEILPIIKTIFMNFSKLILI